MKKLLLYLFILLIPAHFVDAQEHNIVDSSELIVPPLVDVINAALRYSPLLKAKDTEIKIIEHELKIEKKKWMDNVSIDGVANYGLFDQFVISGSLVIFRKVEVFSIFFFSRYNFSQISSSS